VNIVCKLTKMVEINRLYVIEMLLCEHFVVFVSG